MTRFAFFLACLVTLAMPAGAAVMVAPTGPDPVYSTITTAQDPSALITLTKSGKLEILQALFIGPISSLSLVGPGVAISSGMIAGPSYAVPTAFANAIDLAAGTYLLSVASAVLGTTTFAVSEVPLPGAVALLGSALVGLMGYRRLRAPS